MLASWPICLVKYGISLNFYPSHYYTEFLNVMVGTFFMTFVPNLNKYPKMNYKNSAFFKREWNCFSPSPFFAGCSVRCNVWYGTMEAKFWTYPILFFNYKIMKIAKLTRTHYFLWNFSPTKAECVLLSIEIRSGLIDKLIQMSTLLL